jgi:predicted amidohydrolase
MTTELCIAGIQMNVTGDISRQVETITAAIDRASAAGADILLTPEGSLSGYSPVFDVEAVETGLTQIVKAASEKRVALALGTCYREEDGLVYNQIRFFDRDGVYQGFHSKILRCGTMTDKPEGEINDYGTTPLRTFEVKGIRVGGLICNDLWADPSCTPMADPYLTHQLARQGVRVIFHAVNGGRDGSLWAREVVWAYHEMNLRMRAAADKIWIVTVDNCYPVEIPCSAPSGVINPNGQMVCRVAAEGQQFFMYTIETVGIGEAG